MSSYLVSAVIIGRNEGDRLVRCLESVKAMNFQQDKLEILYIDSNSTDGSMERAESMGARSILVPPGPPTAARGRNTGIANAQAPFLFFLDGDTIVDPDFLSKALNFLEANPDYAGVCGDRREIAPQDSIYNRVLDLDWNGPVGDVQYFGGDAVVRKAVLDEVGPYKIDLIAGEEPELCHRIRKAGYKVKHLDLAMTGHDLALTRFKDYWTRSYRTGHAYAEVADLTDGETFGHASKRNLIQTLFYMASPILLLLVLRFWAVPLMVGGGLLVWARTVWRSRWRKASLGTIIVYALHGHFCQFPIFFGQLKYFRNRSKNVSGKLIEYK